MAKIILLLVITVCFLGMFPLAFAQESTPLSPLPSPTLVDYALPYPGILPDHPLYFIKQIRDQILLLLITNPIRRVEFYILMADKHLTMSVALFDKQKPELGLKTISKGVDNIQKAAIEIFEIPIEGNAEVANTKARLEQSLTKHLEIVSLLHTKVNQDKKQQLDSIKVLLQKLLDDFNKKN